ncbi:DUF3575 domain-containing protein [Bacteroides sp.]|uniref:DUF3575 domain-containing protein n=1 Tax=Bacteroides sp. TaxID=29523 RepID=UPI00260B1D3C|nr:DUF3575 domain-containing protein [Bacteroides sp.]MDD3038749.1 DUF3575 domain-containing protein [Bacteroides sp.]
MVFSGFFCGAYTGGGVYRLNKNILPIFGYLKQQNSLQVGQTLIVGLTTGDHFGLNKHFGFEIVVDYGKQCSMYESYTRIDDVTIIYHSVNGSAKYLPIKAGLLVVIYRF